MVQKCHLIIFLVLFLGLSGVISSSFAVPTTRSQRLKEENPTSVQDILSQDAMDLNVGDELLDVGEGYIEGRMDLQSTDYSGPGANNHHDPKTPGRA